MRHGFDLRFSSAILFAEKDDEMSQPMSEGKVMEVWLWEMTECFFELVLFDGENTYWTEEMKPSAGYARRKLGVICPVTRGRFTYVGKL